MDHHLSEKEVSFPHIVSAHGISVKIYRGKNNGYSSFFVHWRDAGGRRCKRCATFEKAQEEADIAIHALLRGQTEVLNLTRDDRLTYLRSQEYLKPFGIRLDQACREYAEMRKRLGDATLIEAVRFFGEHRPDQVAQKMVSEIVAELLRSRARDGRSEVYLKALRTALGRFAAAFPRPILTIKRREIDEYLRSDYVGLSARSRNNAAGYIRTLFSFAKNKDYLFQDRRTEATKLARARMGKRERGLPAITPSYAIKPLGHILSASAGFGWHLFVCENPNVVGVAADRLGRSCAPLICTEGQAKTTVHILLHQLTAAGVQLFYHGDFDWPGIQMANAIIARHGALPWRMNASDYRSINAGDFKLSSVHVQPSWDPALLSEMLNVGRAIHEEQVIDHLLNDLKTR